MVFVEALICITARWITADLDAGSTGITSRRLSRMLQSPATERRENTLHGFKDFYLRAKARLWP